MYIDFRTSGGSRLAGISNRKIIEKDSDNNKIRVSGTVIDSDTLTTGCYITLANDIGFNNIYNRVIRIGKQNLILLLLMFGMLIYLSEDCL